MHDIEKMKGWLKAYYLDCDSEFCSGCNFGNICNDIDDNAPRVISEIIDSLQAENAQLQQKYTQAMELLGLAVEDMCSDDIQDCKTCIYHSSHNPNCPQNSDVCIWKWQHADKLEELRGGKAD